MRIAREVALYNQGSIENGIDDASKVATSFITFVSSAEGIKVHNADDLSDYIQVNSNAISMYRGNTEKMKLTDSSLRLGDTSNNAYIDTDGMKVYQDGNISASFGSTGAQIGKDSTGHAILTASGMTIYGSDGTVELANISYGSGETTSGQLADAPYFTFGTRASGSDVGNNSFAEGYRVTASGANSHAEGADTVASKQSSHAEGLQTTAEASMAHAEGQQTTAHGYASHAEGYYTFANGRYSHAGGNGTVADGESQTAVGKYNVADSSSLFIVGNGTIASRTNALTVDSSNNLRINGDLYVGCNADSSGGTPIGYVLDTDGSWSWKKYTDGTFEMWRHYGGAPATGSHYTTINGFYGYYVSGFNFPSSCKPTNANYFVKTSWSIGNGFVIDSTGLGKTATGFNIYALATASSQTTVTADIYVVGRWK